jgi:hypothetical protein
MRNRSINPHPKAKLKAEIECHKYIVLRDRGICFTCGSQGNQAGHFKHGKLDLDERNLHCQCYICNVVKNGNLKVYEEKLTRLYGQEWVDKLILDSNTMSNKFSIDELDQIYEKYKNKIKNIPFTNSFF